MHKQQSSRHIEVHIFSSMRTHCTSNCICTLQAGGFPADLQCRFGNASLVYVVNAIQHEPHLAYCTSPEWLANDNTRVNFSAIKSSSDCLTGVEFAYYLDPQVSQVAPLSGPRYGSFELRVQLEQTVCSFADEVRIQSFRHRSCCCLHMHRTELLCMCSVGLAGMV